MTKEQALAKTLINNSQLTTCLEQVTDNLNHATQLITSLKLRVAILTDLLEEYCSCDDGSCIVCQTIHGDKNLGRTKE